MDGSPQQILAPCGLIFAPESYSLLREDASGFGMTASLVKPGSKLRRGVRQRTGTGCLATVRSEARRNKKRGKISSPLQASGVGSKLRARHPGFPLMKEPWCRLVYLLSTLPSKAHGAANQANLRCKWFSISRWSGEVLQRVCEQRTPALPISVFGNAKYGFLQLESVRRATCRHDGCRSTRRARVRPRRRQVPWQLQGRKQPFGRDMPEDILAVPCGKACSRGTLFSRPQLRVRLLRRQ